MARHIKDLEPSEGLEHGTAGRADTLAVRSAGAFSWGTPNNLEVIRALRKGQAAAFNFTRDIRGEARIVEHAFGIGVCALTEAVTLVREGLECQAA